MGYKALVTKSQYRTEHGDGVIAEPAQPTPALHHLDGHTTLTAFEYFKHLGRQRFLCQRNPLNGVEKQF